MAKMKRFFVYFLILIALYIFVTVLTNFNMKEKLEDIKDLQININSPKIVIEESKATASYGYIKGNITNDTGEHIKDKYLQFDFYNKDGAYVGTESKEIKYFNVNEKVSFEIQYSYKNVSNIKIDFKEKVVKPKVKNVNVLGLTEEQKTLAIPAAIIIGLYLVLP